MIITVAHQKGGVGKSTLATNLAVVLNAPLFDLDKQHSSVLFNLAREEQIQNEKEIPSIQCYTLENSQCGLECQTPIKNDEIFDFLDQFKESEKNIIVDCGGFDGSNNRIAIAYADYILTPVSPSGIEIYGLNDFEHILEITEEQVGESRMTHVLINNADVRSQRRIIDLQKYISTHTDHFKPCRQIISRRVDFQRAYEEGLAVTERDPVSKSAAEIRKLVREILETIHKEKETK